MGAADRGGVCGEGGCAGDRSHLSQPGDHLSHKEQWVAAAELQFITGHAKRETLAIYQHVALDAELQKKYEEAMKGAGL